MLLIHGFGANSRHWRHTLPALSDGAQVVALDLLGFGASDKPASCLDGETPRAGAVRYGFDLWASQVVELIASLLQPASDAPPPAIPIAGAATTPTRRLHLVGNSIGGMVALRAACLLQQRQTLQALPQPAILQQLVLIDCAQRRLDDKRLAEAPPLAQLGRPALKQLVRQRWLVGSLFRWLARPAVIRRVLKQAYPSGANIDDELVELLYRPSTEAGAVESFRGFVNLFNDALAPQLLEQLSEAACVPVRLIWGAADPWEDPAEARQWAERFRCIQALEVLPGVGHCPHDEAPELVNPILRRWVLAPDPQDPATGPPAVD